MADTQQLVNAIILASCGSLQYEQQIPHSIAPPNLPGCWLLHPGVGEPYEGMKLRADQVVILNDRREGAVM